jgi:hypothetical protein
MKRIAALTLVAALAATGAAADNTKTKPTVSTQVGLAGSGLAPGALVIGLVTVAVVAAAADASSGT